MWVGLGRVGVVVGMGLVVVVVVEWGFGPVDRTQPILITSSPQ